MTIGDKLKSVREQTGWKQDVVAAVLMVSQGYISKIENGQQPPSFGFLSRFSREFGIELDDLVVGTDYKMPTSKALKDKDLWCYCPNKWCEHSHWSPDRLPEQGKSQGFLGYYKMPLFTKSGHVRRFCPVCGDAVIPDCPECGCEIEFAYQVKCTSCGAKTYPGESRMPDEPFIRFMEFPNSEYVGKPKSLGEQMPPGARKKSAAHG